jgi:hypothetical protein
MSIAAPRLATAADLIALGEVAAEVVGGAVVYKADPSAEHGDAQASLANLSTVNISMPRAPRWV